MSINYAKQSQRANHYTRMLPICRGRRFDSLPEMAGSLTKSKNSRVGVDYIGWMRAIGTDSMGAIAPRPKSCEGDAPKSPAHEFCHVKFLNQ